MSPEGSSVTTSSGVRNSDPDLSLSSLLKHAVVDAKEKAFGRLEDVIVRLRDDDYPLLTGLVIGVGGSRIFVSVSDVATIDGTAVAVHQLA